MKLKEIVDEVLLESSVKSNERVNIYRDDRFIIVSPLTHRASCKYGANTNWCISTPSSSEQFDRLNQRNVKFIAIIDRNPPTRFSDDEIEKIYDSCHDDKNLDSCLVLDIYEAITNEFDVEVPTNKQNIAKDVIRRTLTFGKLMLEINSKGNYTIWSGENYNIREFFPFFKIEDIGLPQEAVQNIRNFITNK